MSRVRRVQIRFPPQAMAIHDANLERKCHFCGWIPAECPMCGMVGINPVYVSPEPPGPCSPVLVLCLECCEQLDWAEPFALLAQKPPDFVPNVRVPARAPAWLQAERFPDDEHALRHHLQAWRRGVSTRGDSRGQSLCETPEAASLKATIKSLTEAQSGIYVGAESKVAPEDPVAELHELADKVPDEGKLQAVLEGLQAAYSRIPEDFELRASRKALLDRMYAIAAESSDGAGISARLASWLRARWRL